MNPRMSKEREKEIRDKTTMNRMSEGPDARSYRTNSEVLAIFSELDAVREELANARLEKQWTVIKERDRLRAENVNMGLYIGPEKLEFLGLKATSLLARRWAAMEKVVVEAQKAVESYKGSTPLTEALDALEKEK